MDVEAAETAESLRLAASNAGHHISLVMLKKWRAAGLLPRASQRSRGRGRGTETLYPIGSTDQLLRLLEIRAEGGRFDPERALWRLWWEGWPVEPFHMKARLDERLVAWERADTSVADDDGDMLDAFSDHRLPTMLARTRKRVGTEAMPTVMRLILDALGGRAPKSWQDADDASTLVRALGLESTVRSLGPDASQFTDELACTLKQFGDAVSPCAMRNAVLTSGETELAAARDDLRNAVAGARILWNVLSGLLSRSNAARDSLSISLDDTFDSLPYAILTLLALRQEPIYRGVLDALPLASAAVVDLAGSLAKVNQIDTKKPPRRLEPSGGTARRGKSPCTPSLAP